ncbi:lactosylceramide 4-alpha-galactosyltransferase-like [Drosophila nasuta]|uniref:Lactosylceramide 4-alpha-galactosyltransferase-like n=1 Tax=Drosophila albomicans TaxID=7291 RepID=A0A6P8XSP5_DROAB|nr:lactosylceramide 4-alpha-galactosyltransferase-like [Drosophila albomicans]XP_060666813.1 lactosylceramide 4-alpha-galactosyltransferase-like [Drosophila nasuta]
MDTVPTYGDANQNILEDVLFSKEKPATGKTIFFIETKCERSNLNYNILNFTAHNACGIESAALHHPTHDVYVLVACPTFRPQADPMIDAMLSYKNVKFRYVNLWRFAEGTIIEEWLKTEALFQSKYLMNNMSNLLRLLALYRYGGIYMDEDVIMFRSLKDESPNFMGAETEDSIGNSVIGMEPTGHGRLFSYMFLDDFKRNYSGNVWGYNGPDVLVRMMKVICGTNDVNLMRTDATRCLGIKVLNVTAFYEINWLERDNFFDETPKIVNETLTRLKKSYGMHTWNHVKTNWTQSVNSPSAYIQLVAKNCPKVFAATGKRFT